MQSEASHALWHSCSLRRLKGNVLDVRHTRWPRCPRWIIEEALKACSGTIKKKAYQPFFLCVIETSHVPAANLPFSHREGKFSKVSILTYNFFPSSQPPAIVKSTDTPISVGALLPRALLRTTASQTGFALRMIDSLSSLSELSLLCPMSSGFNFHRWYLRQNEARSSAGPVWPTKSRHSRAALEFNQLFEQLSVWGPANSSSVEGLLIWKKRNPCFT